MPVMDHYKFFAPAWGLSLLLHGLAVGLAMIFAAQIRPDLKEEPFKWDVALIDAVKPSIPESSQSVAPQAQAQARSKAVVPRPAAPTHEAALNRVAPQHSAQMVHPQTQAAKPIEEKVEAIAPPRVEPVEQMAEVRRQANEPIEQNTMEAPKPKSEPVVEAQKPEPAQQNEPVIAQRESGPPIIAADVREDRPTQTPASDSPPIEPMRGEGEHPAKPAPAAEPAPAVGLSESSTQVAKAAPGPETKADHRWVGESLWRRVAELKRYPASARVNGQEGKVILKAVIRSDGQLAEVSVQKSSGHHILDTAAMEAVRLACPLHMKHAISKSEIVVNLPIVYSLAN